MTRIDTHVEQKKTHVGTMEKQFKQWGAKLDEFVAKAEKAGSDAKLDYQLLVDEMKAKHEVARSKLEALRAATSDEWDTARAGVESAWKELEVAFKKLTN